MRCIHVYECMDAWCLIKQALFLNPSFHKPYFQDRNYHTRNHPNPKYVATLVYPYHVIIFNQDGDEITWHSSSPTQQRCLSDMWLPKDGGEITCNLCPHMTSYRVVPLRLPKHRLFFKKKLSTPCYWINFFVTHIKDF